MTLGVSIDPVTRESGGPTLEENVHVGPGAVVLGPVTIGSGSKVMANAVVMASVRANSVVEIAAPAIRSRSRSTVARANSDENGVSAPVEA